MMKTSIIKFLSTMGTAEPLRHPTGHLWDKGNTTLWRDELFWEATQLLYGHWEILYRNWL